MIEITLNRKDGDFGFEAVDALGHTIKMDTSPESGGGNYGVRPMQVLLMGMGGCSGIDIVMILKKQRQVIENFSMKVDGEREKGKEPSLWENVNIIFELTGNIDYDKAVRACELSMNKYCSVAETLRRSGTKLTWEVKVIPPSPKGELSGSKIYLKSLLCRTKGTLVPLIALVLFRFDH